jgi:hexosaminidase
LDCGQEGYTNPGGYWCGPYHEWFHIYQYIADMQQKWDLHQPFEEKKSDSAGRVIGSEILLWGEENGEQTVEQKVWPRGAALAEALWSNPQAGWYAADPRMQLWRNTLVARGIGAEEIQPLWCAQSGPYSCTVDEGTPE